MHILIVALLVACVTTLASPTYAQNDVAPAEEENEFHFVVLGDAQFDNPTAFNRIVDQTARLSPAFVIQVGDLINGYSDDLQLIRTEWQRFQNQIAPLGNIPFYAIAGNHDVYGGNKKPDEKLEHLFTETWGPLHFSFTYKNALFIGLNSDSHTSPEQVSEAQIKWMRKVLRQSEARHRFVFMHRPPMLMDNSERLHRVFVKGEVSQVIYGHHHHLHHFERDGVKYTMTNAGGSMAHNVKAVGGFPHLLHVAIRGDAVSVAVIDADAVHPQDMVPPADNYDLFRLGRALAPQKVALQALEQANHYSLGLALKNPTDRDITAYVSCSSDDKRWHFMPPALDPVSLPPNEGQRLEITVHFEPDRPPESQPECNVQVPFQTSRGEWLEFNQAIETTQ